MSAGHFYRLALLRAAVTMPSHRYHAVLSILTTNRDGGWNWWGRRYWPISDRLKSWWWRKAFKRGFLVGVRRVVEWLEGRVG